MSDMDITRKADNEIIDIITQAGRTAEKWNEAKKALGLKESMTDGQRMVKNRFEKLKKFENRFKNNNQYQKNQTRNNIQKNFKFKKSGKTYVEQTEGIDSAELNRRKAAGECQRCAWPADREESHKTMDCFRWSRKEKGTAPFLKAKVHQNLNVGA